MSTTYAPVPRAKTINIRLIIFLIVATAPVAIALYAFLGYNGGISHHSGYEEVDLKALGNFPFDQNKGTTNDVPTKFRALDGKRVQLEGFLWDPQTAAGDRVKFQFVYNVAKCCFSGPPQVQERVFAVVPPSVKFPDMNYGRLTGTLHVKVDRDKDGVVQSVYTLDVEKGQALDN